MESVKIYTSITSIYLSTVLIIELVSVFRDNINDLIKSYVYPFFIRTVSVEETDHAKEAYTLGYVADPSSSPV